METECRPIGKNGWEELKALHARYKREIGEDAPNDADFDRLFQAVEQGKIQFYGCFCEGRLIGVCSVSPTFSTFNYQPGGVFEDFYVLPEYRKQGIARKLVECARRESGVCSLLVGCADCDVDMYKALGFSVPLGNMLAYDD